MRTDRASLFGRVPSVACCGLFASVLLAGASTATAGWIWPPLGSNSYSYGFNPDPGGGPICPGTTVSISANISDQDTWSNGTPSGASLTVKVKCTLTGPGVNRVWSATGTDSAPPLPLGASASISGSYELCTPGQYTLVFEFQEISPADDPGFPNPTTKTIHFTVEGPEVTVDIEDVTCCPGCSYPLQIELTNNGDCPEDYEWELTGNGPALDPATPFSQSQGTVTVPANSTVYRHPHVNTNPNAERGDTASVTITLTTTDDCPADTKIATATVTIGRPDLVIDGVGEDDEEDPGVFVVLNDDDDDDNGVADLEQDEPGERPVPGENDLIPITMSAGGLPDCGRLTLSVGESPYCGNITLWTTAQKDAQPASLDWDLSQGAPPTLYVEGIGTSCGPRDVTFTLTYYNDDCDPPQCSCSDVVKLTVVDVDISLNGVPETLEESEGAFIRYNEDDDDSSGVPDREESPLLGADDDLVPMSMTYAPTSLHCGQLELTWSGSQVKVWDTTSKGAEITAPTWPADGSSIPTLYVEGYEASAALADVPFTFRWTCDQGNGFEAQDVAKATVIRANLVLECVEDKDETEPGAYLIENYDDDDKNSQADKLHNPVTGEDDLLALTLQIEPEIDMGTVTLVRGAGLVLWTTPEKESVVLLYGAQAWDLETEELPEEPYYVEGFDPGSTALLLDWRAPGKFDAIPDHIYVHVFNVDVDWPQVPDEEEEEPPGWIICVNDDDDDDSGTADSEESPVIGEDDLAAIGLSYSFGAGNPPEGTKWAIECSDNVAIWRDAEKQEAVECGTWQELETFPDPGVLYVEGLQPGAFEITLKIGAGDDPCVGAKDKIVGAVLKVDLHIEALDEADEEDPGAFVSFNDDDDDHSQQLDYQQHQAPDTPVVGENDLVRVTLSIAGLPTDCGRLTLTYDGGILVWTSADKAELVPSATYWEPPSAVPQALWIEGVAASGAERDASLTLTYGAAAAPHACDAPGCACADRVMITIVDVELDAAGTSDEEEEDPGARVQWNFDQDEHNTDGGRTRPDLWDEELVVHDGSGNPTGVLALDDLLPLSRSFAPASSSYLMDHCEITFANSQPTRVRVYTVDGAATPPIAELLPLGVDLKADYFAPGAPRAAWSWYAEGIECGEADLELTCNYPGGSTTDLVRVSVVGARLHSVTFGDNHSVTQDDGNAYAGEDWLDDDDDGEATDLDEHRFPVAYTRNTRGKIDSVVFDACPATFAPGGPTNVRGTDGFGNHYLADASKIAVGSSTVTVTDMEADANFPNEVRFVDPYTIAWEISDDNGTTWLPVGESDNRLFLLLDNPQTTLYETVGEISCRNADGISAVNDLFPPIWSEFADLDVRRKPIDGFNRTDGVRMGYWRPRAPTPQSLAGMLDANNGNGACGAWAMLLAACFQVQGVTPIGAYPHLHIVEVLSDPSIYTPPSPSPTGFLVKEWVFGNDGILTGPNGINDSDAQGDDAVIIPKGQGLPHTLCMHGGPNGTVESAPGGDDYRDDLGSGVWGVFTGGNGVCETEVQGDEQVLPPGQGLSDAVCVGAGPDGVLATTPSGNDQVVGDTITTGSDGICETPAQIDEQVIPMGQGLPGTVCVRPGPNGVLATTPSGDDQVQGATITTGADGICDTEATDDDEQVLSVGRGEPGVVCVGAGPGALATTPGGDDQVVSDTITTGADGVCDTRAVDDAQAIPVGQGAPNAVCVRAGPAGYLVTTPGGDDQVAGDTITTGADGVCNTTAALYDDVQVIPLGQGQPNTMGIIEGPNMVVDTAPTPDDVAGSGAPGGGRFPYEMNVSVVNLPGIAGQDNPEPPPAFRNHYILRVRWSATLSDFTLYDPSYGGIGYSTENDHENAAIDGIRGPWAPSGNNPSARVNNTTTQELSYTDY